jgi:hypothetical protein
VGFCCADVMAPFFRTPLFFLDDTRLHVNNSSGGLGAHVLVHAYFGFCVFTSRISYLVRIRTVTAAFSLNLVDIIL